MIHFTGTRQQLFQPGFILAQFALQEIVTKTETLIGNSSLFEHAYLWSSAAAREKTSPIISSLDSLQIQLRDIKRTSKHFFKVEALSIIS